ncbi:MAG: radical SAM protein [Deltaproteobacteria bacterium]|nr:radical SAM protein [Deltaproteobacteria bacterium]
MRVLLLQAISTPDSGEMVYPLGLARLGAALAPAHELWGLDLNLHPFPWPRVLAVLEEFQPQVVAISFRNLDPLAGILTSFVPPLQTLAGLVRAAAPEARILLGGAGFSLFAARIMAEVPQVDLGVVGEAEEVLPQLLACLERPQAVPGVLWRDNGGLAGGLRRHCQGLGELPLPAWDLFPPGDYLARNRYVACLGVETKRGCPHGCRYCLYPTLQGGRVRLRPPTAVVDEIAALVTRYGVELIHFTDPVLNQPAGHLNAICRELLARGLKLGWTGFFREDALDPADLALWARAGLNTLYFSGDGASDPALSLLNKGLSLADLTRAAELAAGSGLIAVYHFLANLPGENQATADQARELLARLLATHARAGNPAAVVINNLRLYPGAPLTQEIMERGLIPRDTDLLYPVYFNPPPFDGLRHELTALATSPGALNLVPGPLERP